MRNLLSCFCCSRPEQERGQPDQRTPLHQDETAKRTARDLIPLKDDPVKIVSDGEEKSLTPVNQDCVEVKNKPSDGIRDDLENEDHRTLTTKERPTTLAIRSEECSQSKRPLEQNSPGIDVENGSSLRSDSDKSPHKTNSQKSQVRLRPVFSRKTPEAQNAKENSKSAQSPSTVSTPDTEIQGNRDPCISGQASNGFVARSEWRESEPRETNCKSDPGQGLKLSFGQSSAEDRKLTEHPHGANAKSETEKGFKPLRDSTVLRRVQSDNRNRAVLVIPPRKKFVDSTFYSDPDGKYPTLEEQVHLAQSVAQSILLPVNRNTRGHRMFVTMRQRARAWTIGATQDEIAAALGDLDPSRSETIRFHRDNSWTPEMKQEIRTPDPTNNPEEDVLRLQMMSVTGVQSSVLFAPNLKAEMTSEQMGALSSEEFERVVQLQEMEKLRREELPTPTKPICWRFPGDFRQMRGKGAKLFASRQATAEGWTTDETRPAHRTDAVPPSNPEDEADMGSHAVCSESEKSGGETKIPPKTFSKKSTTNHTEKQSTTVVTISLPPSCECDSVSIKTDDKTSSSRIT